MKISVSLRGSSSRLRSGGSLAIESRSAVTTESERSLASAMNAIHLPSGDTTTSRCEYFVFVIGLVGRAGTLDGDLRRDAA